VTIAEPSERNKIIIENFAVAISGHKGITKTYKRIRHKYFWSGMKVKIQIHTGIPELSAKKN
jgi:hypothetical protein